MPKKIKGFRCSGYVILGAIHSSYTSASYKFSSYRYSSLMERTESQTDQTSLLFQLVSLYEADISITCSDTSSASTVCDDAKSKKAIVIDC